MDFANQPRVLRPGRAALRKILLAATLIVLVGCGPKKGAAENSAPNESAIKGPATVQQAAQILDLSKFPLLEGAKAPGSRQVANLS